MGRLMKSMLGGDCCQTSRQFSSIFEKDPDLKHAIAVAPLTYTSHFFLPTNFISYNFINTVFSARLSENSTSRVFKVLLWTKHSTVFFISRLISTNSKEGMMMFVFVFFKTWCLIGSVNEFRCRSWWRNSEILSISSQSYGSTWNARFH